MAARTWDEHTNELGAEPEVRADVFVFAVQTCKDHGAYDVHEIAQWEFYVVAAGPIRNSGYKSLTISWVARHAELASRVEAVHRAAASSRCPRHRAPARP